MLSHTLNARRKTKKRRYKTLFVLSVEGWKTEPQYFSFLNKKVSTIHVEFLRDKHKTAPPQVLERMKNHLKEGGLKRSDEAWLVVDKDKWGDNQLSPLHQWSQEKANYGLALSNPNFEFWLLLHFEEGRGVSDSEKCTKKLNTYLPHYDKGIDAKIIENVEAAIDRAKKMNTKSYSDLLSSKGTTVYKLVESLLKSRENE